ncbi:hypothetical protein Peur_000326 [Populus x canadensis]
MEIVRKEEDGDDEEEELKTILLYQFEYIPNQTPKVYFGAKENGEQMDIHHFAPRFRLTWIKRSTRMRLGMARWKWSGIFNPIVPLSSVIDMMPSS